MTTTVLPAVRSASARAGSPQPAGYKVDISRGERISRVSSEWFSRPDDERYLSLGALHAAVRARAERATARTVETRALRVEASRDDTERLTLIVPGQDMPVAPTHWSYGQLCSLVGAPASYMRQLPAPLAGINLQHGLLSHRAELVKTLEADDGRIELRAVTGPDYGRIWDHELVEAVMRIAGDGTGDTRWKVPGLLDWSTMTHNPFVEVTKDTTTLYASDRDVFLFLVDDAHPIEAGRLPNGEPDLYFRGFYCWNSEVGSKTLGMASFYLRAVCMNRNIWGAEAFEEISIRHSKFAGHRFAHQAAPALERFATSSPAPFMAGIRAAREAIVARKDEDRETFLRKRGFSRPETDRIIATVLEEEDRPPESIFDFVHPRGTGLYGHRPFDDEPDHRPLPEATQITGAIVDIFDALAVTLQDTRLEPDLETLLWGQVNLFHRAVDRIERELDDNEQAQKRSQREQDGSEVKSVELERLLAEGMTLIERRNAFELMRDLAAEQFETHTRHAWRPHVGSMVNRKALTSAMIDSRDFLAARKRAETEVMLPAGPKIAFTGGLDITDHRLVWDTLDKVNAKHPGMVLMHGGSPKGAELIASRWADSRNVAQIAFKPNWTRHVEAARHIFETNTLGTIAMMQAVLPQMRERRAGVIVNVTSSVTYRPLPLLSVYTASKAAVNAFTDSVALELEPLGVRVRVVLPGRAPDTSFGDNARARMTSGFPEPYAGLAQQVFAGWEQDTGPVTSAGDVAEAVWRAVTDKDSPAHIAAGADAVATSQAG